MVPLLIIENTKERWKKIERYIQSIKNICKLKWLIPDFSNSLFISSGNTF